MSIGATEILVVAGIAVLLFGGKAFPKLARGLGESLREIRNVGKEMEDTWNE